MKSVTGFDGKKVDDEAVTLAPKPDAKVPEILASRTGQAIRFHQWWKAKYSYLWSKLIDYLL